MSDPSEELRRTREALREAEARLEAEIADGVLLRNIGSELIREENVEALYDKIVDAAVAIMRSDYASMQMPLPARCAACASWWRRTMATRRRASACCSSRWGTACAPRLRQDERFARVPIMAVSGFGQELDRKRASESGFDYHFTKPADPQAIQQAIERGRAAERPS